MAQVQKIVKVCDRDAFGKEKPATTKRRFMVDGEFYKLDLCEQHGEMFDREMMGWIRLAQEDEYNPAPRGMLRSSTVFTAEEKERDRRASALREEQARQDAEVRELVQRQKMPELDLAPEPRREISEAALKWVLTPHAEKRAQERGYDLYDVLEAAEHPEATYKSPPKYGDKAMLHQRGGCTVAVDRAQKLIITVLHSPQSPLWANYERERIAQ